MALQLPDLAFVPTLAKDDDKPHYFVDALSKANIGI